MQSSAAEDQGSTESYWGGWFNTVKSQTLDLAAKAQVLAAEAGKVAHEKATQIAKQAQELRDNYDLEVATSILMGSANSAPALSQAGNIDTIKLTKADLTQLDMVYVTENMVAMAFPKDKTAKSLPPSIAEQEGNDINIVAAYLKKKHQGRFMIWNISEEGYDYGKFSDQVLEYKFPGHPAPPLGLLFKICTSVESWLDADDKNVAVIHCLTGKGRTATLMACILTWLGEFDSPMQALQYVAQRKNTVVDYLTIPSQRRYIQYFSNLLDGVKPSSEPLLLRRVIVNSIPSFGHHPEAITESGCCPYIQLFKNGKLVASAAVEQEHAADDGLSELAAKQLQLKWVRESEGSASFRLDTLVQGDILLRCRHAAQSGARVSMFRAAFHTGYISGGVLRLTKAQCDGSAADTRFSDDFFIDLIFAPGSSTEAQQVTSGRPMEEAALSDKYETSLHKDARFWESISQRKAKSKKRKARKFMESQQDQFSIADDSKFLSDQDSRNASSAHEKAGSGTSSAAAAAASASRSYVDEELIKELAQLETETSSSPEGSGSGVEVSRAGSSTATEQGADSDDYLLLGKKPTTAAVMGVEAGGVLLTPPHQQPTSTAASASAAMKSEFLALDELEKELGLDDLQLFSNEKGPKPPAAPPLSASKAVEAAVEDFEDNLDELEKYLQSLSVPSK